ncbi:MAG: hypothetical protein WB526_01855 [Candidatus Cybelea sp.]
MIALCKKDLTEDFRRNAAPDESVRTIAASTARRVAVFAIHGISPIQQYAFQDQVALALQSYLNSQLPSGSTFTWLSIVHWPQVASQSADGATVRPTALRLYRSDDKPEEPNHRVYDVYEGYWSPLSKGKTTIASALRWLLNGTFLGTSSTAAIPCSPGKLAFDLSYVISLLIVALFACAVALAFGYKAWTLLANVLPAGSNVTFADLIQDPFRTAFKLPLLVYAQFLVDLVIGYVIAQLFTAYNAARKRRVRQSAISDDADKGGHFTASTISARKFHVAMFLVLWITLGLLIWLALYVAGRAALNDDPKLLALYIASLAVSIAFLQLARSLADFAVENVLGDIQIYTTHDCNSAFYAIRQQIISSVASALNGVLSAVVDEKTAVLEPYYDAVHIFGHSLGSTVGMDVLIRLRQMLNEKSIAAAQWNKIRSFTTFGTSLEKTRFFFDVRQPSLNASQDQWEGDVYGRFFTDKFPALDGDLNDRGIYWSNHWYFRDIVSNEIVSYKSDSSVGNFSWMGNAPRKICKNFQIPHDRWPFAWVHSDYLADARFWKAAGPVLTR